MGLIGRLAALVGGPGACAGCGRGLHGPYLEALGRRWHPEHFRCALCGRPLGTRFLVSSQGEPFCSSHEGAAVLCTGCGRLAPAPAGGETLCPACALDANLDAAGAARLLGQIQAALRRAGLPWWPQTFPLRLVSPRELREAAPAGVRNPNGLILTQVTTLAGGRQERRVTGILALAGLPRPCLGMVLAHELGHAWVFQRGLQGLPRDLEEGFCELCSSLWLATLQDARCAHLQGKLAGNLDPVYGGGYRKVLAVQADQGLAGVLDWLETNVHAAEGRPGERTRRP